MKLMIISGLSGSGKSVALNTLEDLGYNCVDNLPLGLLPAYAEQLAETPEGTIERAAVGIDARNRPKALQAFPRYLQHLRESGFECQIIFLQASDGTLIKRFSETRRKHPLSHHDRPLTEAIAVERRLLDPLSAAADLYIDTSHTTLHQLRAIIRERVNKQAPGQLSLQFQSFGFKHGVPGDADFVFDVRCLPNPHWIQELRPLSGRDREVIEFLDGHQSVRDMRDMLSTFLTTWIPHFEAENRSYLTVAIGCTGGQHRSVYLVESLAAGFADRYDNVSLQHRELA